MGTQKKSGKCLAEEVPHKDGRISWLTASWHIDIFLLKSTFMLLSFLNTAIAAWSCVYEWADWSGTSFTWLCLFLVSCLWQLMFSDTLVCHPPWWKYFQGLPQGSFQLPFQGWNNISCLHQSHHLMGRDRETQGKQGTVKQT